MRTAFLYISLIVLAGMYPFGALAHADDTPVDTPATTAVQPTDTDNTASPDTDTPPADDTSTAAPAATDTPTTTSTTSSTTSDDTSASATNSLDSTATTGDASVTDNTTAGSATSGDASASATVINNVNSAVGSNNQPPATFVSDIYGNVQGDIVLQPMIQQATVPLNSTPADDTTLTVNNGTQLTNDITLSATSGDASVTDNTKAGNATSGTATTMANIVNVINSMVSAGQSFVGTINIYGSLNGDILISPDFIPQLLADNSQNGSTNETVSTADMQSILNNVSLTAQSGAATVANNSSAGSATTGDAVTHVVIFNMSGHQVIASDSLLVFVNVLGQWVGLIVDAPAGTTAAAIGDGVTQNSTAGNTTTTTNSSAQIINNIVLNSQTGDATVANNTTAGNATSGKASATANIANITNDSLGLAGWFGILFINVFGSWFGSFGVNTSAGNPPTSQNRGVATKAQVISFIPHQSAAQTLHFASLTPSANSDPVQSSTPTTTQPAVLGTSTTKTPRHTAGTQQNTIDNWSFIVLVVVVAGLIAAGAHLLTTRQP